MFKVFFLMITLSQCRFIRCVSAPDFDHCCSIEILDLKGVFKIDKIDKIGKIDKIDFSFVTGKEYIVMIGILNQRNNGVIPLVALMINENTSFKNFSSRISEKLKDIVLRDKEVLELYIEGEIRITSDIQIVFERVGW